MNEGTCVLSVNHGNTCDAHLFGDSIFRKDVHPDSMAELGVALTSVLVSDNLSASLFLRSSMIFIVCMSILTLIFVPKTRAWYLSITGKATA